MRSHWTTHWTTLISSLGRGDFWWLSLFSCHVVCFLRCQPLPKITKTTVMAQPLNIETCNENQTSLGLCQSSAWAWCRPSWMVAITDTHKNLTLAELDKLNLTSCGLNWASHSQTLHVLILTSCGDKSNLVWVKCTFDGLYLNLYGLNLTFCGVRVRSRQLLLRVLVMAAIQDSQQHHG